MEGAEQRHLFVASAGESKGMIFQQPENTKNGGSRKERETVIKLNPMRKVSLLPNQVLSTATSCGGEMWDREHGGTHRQSSEFLQRQPVQKMKKTYIPLVDEVLHETSEATAYRGELGDRECRGTHRQTSDLLERQPDQTMENTHICSHCGKRLSSLWDLQIHERIHIKDKPYKCPECEKHFYNKSKLVIHQHVTHNLQFSPLSPEAEQETVTKLNPTRKDAILGHQILSAVTSCVGEMSDREHGGTCDHLQWQPDQTMGNTHICSHCKKILSSHWHLQIHERIHIGDKPYRCPECEKCFYTKDKLVRHQVITHNLQFPLLFREAEVQLVSEQESHPVEGTEQNYLTAPSSGESRGIISQQLENEAAHGSQQEQETVMKLDPMRKDALLPNQVLRETTSQEQETVTKLNPIRKDTLLADQALSAATSCGGEMSDREHGGPHWQSLDLLQRQPVQKIKKTYIPLVDQILSEPTSLPDHSLSGATSAGREVVERCEENVMQSTDFLQGNSAETKKKTYICPQCGKSLCSISSLSRHKRTHSCSVCKKSFSSKSELPEHKKLHKKKKHQCGECGANFATRSQLLNHERIHTGEKPYTCLDCGKHFRTCSNLLSHQKCHKDERPHQCVKCEKSFKFKENLDEHTRIHTGEKPYKCPDCGKCFSHYSSFLVHKKAHNEEALHTCLICGKSFVYRSLLVRHERSHTGEKPYQCLDCGKTYSRNADLSEHKKSHTGERPNQCLECGKSFLFKRYLNEHRRLHTGEKPYTCSECGKCFTFRSRLIKHETSHRKQKLYQCSKCAENFSQKSHFLLHKAIHTRERPLTCLKCEKSFHRVTELLLHKKSHTRKKYDYCLKCRRIFLCHYWYLVHRAERHRDKNLFRCSKCGKNFFWEGSLKMHMNKTCLG